MFSVFSLLIYILIAITGFTMAFLFKNAQTNNLVVNPNPAKTFRQFITIFFIGLIILSALGILTVRTLSSSSITEECIIRFRNYKSVYVFVLSLFFVGLTIIGNYYTLSVSHFRIVPYILIALFYSVFILADAYYIAERYMLWKQAHGIDIGETMVDANAIGCIKAGLGVTVTALNAGMMWWGKRK